MDSNLRLAVHRLQMDSNELDELYENPSDVLFDEGNFFDYGPGGFHPVVLGDTQGQNRYEIRRKVGFGGFSTVWLARDLWLETTRS